MKNRQQILIVLTIVVVALFAGDKLIVGPLTDLWKKRALAIKNLQNDIRDGKLLIARGDSLRRDWDDKRKNTLENSSRAPEQALRVFQDCAQESGASLNGMTPQWKGDNNSEYKTLVCSVDASGSLWNLTRFLYDIEKGPTALKIELLSLASTDNTGRQLNLRLQVSGLVLNSQPQ